MKGYKTSKDYTHLRELLDQGKEVVCFVTYNFNRFHPDQEPMIVTDICMARLLSPNNEEYRRYTFSVRGHGFGDYWVSLDKDRFTFEEFCEADELEYIEPNE